MTIQLNQPFSFCQLGKRDNQEDYRYPNSNRPSDFDPFFIVCDGVGGSADGEIASRAVAMGMAEALKNVDWNRDFTPKDFQIVLGAAYKALDHAATNASSDMATTLTLICFHEGGCSMAYMGDSRIYHFRPNQGILYCSSDHSLINELVHAGVVSPDQALSHPQRNVINRYMAPTSDDEERCQPTWYQTSDIEAGDIFFLCTDGVTDVIDNDTLETIICSDGSDEKKRDNIARLSYHSDDNNTAILVSVAQVIKTEEYHTSEQEDDNGQDTKRIHRPTPVAVDLEINESRNLSGYRVMKMIKKVLNL